MSATKFVDVEHTVASKVPFGQICQLFERVKRAKSNTVRREEFKNFVNKWREHHEQLHAELISQGSVPNDSFFPAMRLLLPQLDRERPSYGVKETLLAKLYIDVLGLSRTNQDAKKLLEFKNPKTNAKSAGDFAEIAYLHILSKRCTTEGSLSIAEINEHLDKLAQYNNERKKEMVQKTLLSLIQQSSATEQKWLIRIMLKDTRLSLGQSVILNEFHPDAEELFNVTTNLQQVCLRLHSPSVHLADAEIALFQPFRPMLALNAKLTDVENLMNHQQFRLEIKYDGERSQIHKDRSQYKYFSRSGREYSTVFGDNPYSGSLTPHIHDLFASQVRTCILDGEMMGYDPDLKLFMQKGGPFDIKHITEASDLQPCFIAFDLLHLNGENLTSKPLAERLNILEGIFKPSEGRIQLTEGKTVSMNQEVMTYLNEAIDRREEGIIVKHPNSPYAPNKRKGSGWFKIKPEYVGGVVDDMDLVIVGGKFGTGRHGSLINKFMLAVREGEGESAIYKSFSMVGSGYTDKELLEITQSLKPHLKVFEKKRPPAWLLLTKEKPEVVLVHPEKSVVVQVRASEITQSAAYATGCTLRFPRIVSTRDDKKAEDAMDMVQLTELRNMADGKLAARHATLARELTPKKRKMRSEPQAAVSKRFQGADLSSVEQTSATFEELEFCVMSGTPENKKVDLEKVIASRGGSVVQNPSSGTYCVIARDEKNVRVRNVIKGEKFDVVKIEWLLRCFKWQKVVPFLLGDMLFTTAKTQSKLSSRLDKYGDDYIQNVDGDELRDLFEKIGQSVDFEQNFPPPEAKGRFSALQACINDASVRYHSYGIHDLPTSLFQSFHFYVNDKLLLNDPTTRVKSSLWTEVRALILFYSGIIDETITEHTTHVIVASCHVPQGPLAEISLTRRDSEAKFHIVADAWLFDSLKKGTLQSERAYEYQEGWS